FASIAPSSTSIYTLSLHDALPIFDQLAAGLGAGPDVPGHLAVGRALAGGDVEAVGVHDALLGQLAQPAERVAPLRPARRPGVQGDRKSTRLNSSHVAIPYAVFWLK